MDARRYDRTLNPLGFGMLALKLTLVPLFLLVVSMSGKWWGPSIAGWLAGLPVVAGPILFILVLAHGSSFGARCHAVPFRNSRFRSIQFRICMDLPLESVAGSTSCRAHYVVYRRVWLISVANFTYLGRDRRPRCCVLRPIVLAAQRGGRSRFAA